MPFAVHVPFVPTYDAQFMVHLRHESLDHVLDEIQGEAHDHRGPSGRPIASRLSMHALRGLAQHVWDLIQDGHHDRLTTYKRAYFLLLRYISEDLPELRSIYDYLAERVYHMPPFGEPERR